MTTSTKQMETATDFVEVTREEFFAKIGPMDVHPYPEGPLPYTSYWHTRDRQLVGKSSGVEYLGNQKYFLRTTAK